MNAPHADRPNNRAAITQWPQRQKPQNSIMNAWIGVPRKLKSILGN
jgi:hypothetical protein